jgi:uncharacterized OsmC-like protein
MKSEELKSIQAPLKENYRSNPKEAFITLSAEGKLGEGVTCSIKTGRALIDAGLHPATGGTGVNICSGDMLLEALVACAGVTMNAVATSLGIEIKEGTLKAEGDIDFRGTLGVSKETPVGLQNIRLNFILNTNANEELLNTLIKLTERYCVVYQTLVNSPKIEFSRTIVQS